MQELHQHWGRNSHRDSKLVSFLASKNLQMKGNLAAVRIAGGCARRELTIPTVVLHFVSGFTECILTPINIKTSKQVHIPPFPSHLLS